MTRYAERTEVSPYKSREEIERTLTRYGASGFGYIWEGERAAVQFRIHGRQVRFILSMPSRADKAITHTPQTRVLRSREAQAAAYDQMTRQRWRALLLIIKAKLEAVEAGIVAMDDEFLANLVLPSGETVGERIVPEIERAYETGELPSLMPGPTPTYRARLKEG